MGQRPARPYALLLARAVARVFGPGARYNFFAPNNLKNYKIGDELFSLLIRLLTTLEG